MGYDIQVLITEINSEIDRNPIPCDESLVDDLDKFLCRVCYEFTTEKNDEYSPWCKKCGDLIKKLLNKYGGGTGRESTRIRSLIAEQYKERRKVWIDRLKQRGFIDVFNGEIIRIGTHSATVDYKGVVCEFNMDEAEALGRIKQRLKNPEYLRKRGSSCSNS